jgi:hypothetical protein
MKSVKDFFYVSEGRSSFSAPLLFALFLSVVFYKSQSLAGVKDFENLSNSTILEYRQQALARVALIDEYRTVKYGIKADQHFSKKFKSIEDFQLKAFRWQKYLRFNSSPTKACLRYFSNVKGILDNLNSGYEKIHELDPESIENLVLRSKLESLQIALHGLFSLADERREGGLTPITNVGSTCDVSERDHWEKENHALLENIDFLSLHFWGQRGVTSAYPISSKLAELYAEKAKWDFYLFTPKIVGNFAFVMIGSEFLVLRFITPLFEGTSPLLLKGVAAMGSSAYATYSVYDHMKGSVNSKIPPIGEWEQVNDFTEQILKLDTDADIPSFLNLASRFEDQLFKLNVRVMHQLQTEMYEAYNKFGDLKNARIIALGHLKEIDQVLLERR